MCLSKTPLVKLPYTTASRPPQGTDATTVHPEPSTFTLGATSLPTVLFTIKGIPFLSGKRRYKVFPLATCSDKYSLHRMDAINQLFVSETPLLAWATFDALFRLSAWQIKSPASKSFSKSTPFLRNNKTITISNDSSQVGNKSSYSTRSLFMAPRKTIRYYEQQPLGEAQVVHTDWPSCRPVWLTAWVHLIPANTPEYLLPSQWVPVLALTY